MWTRVDYGVGKQIFADQARDLVASAVGEQNAALKQLMYEQKDGVILCRFLRNKNGFSILALGNEGKAILREAAPAIILPLARKMGVPVTVSVIAEGSVQAKKLPYRRKYLLRRVVVQKKLRHTRYPDSVMLQQLLRRHLTRQASAMGISLPQQWDLEVLSFREASPVPISGRAYGASVADLTFESNVDFSGYWAAGYLQSRGYGHMFADMPYALRVQSQKTEDRAYDVCQ